MRKIACAVLAIVIMLSLTACKTTENNDTVEGSAVLRPDASVSFSEITEPSSVAESEKPLSSASESSLSSVSSSVSSKSSSASSVSSSAPSSSSSAASSSSSASSSASPELPQNNSSPIDETRAVWISYLEYQSILTGKTEKQFKSSIDSMFAKLADDGFNTVYVHVRSHSDAIYNSDIFPWSVYCSGTEGTDPGYDPLAIMVAKAHNYGLQIEAWINPYRIKGTDDTAKISSGSPAFDWLGTDKVKVLSGKGIFYNPADSDVVELIVSGVKELVRNYDIDGIHFDDYFYPTTAENFDSSYYSAYKNSGGNLSLPAWRRQNVNTLIKEVYSAVKSLDSDCLFGISPSGNMDNNYSSLYCDVYTWATSKGYVDYICPQIYWGFNHETSPYLEILDEFDKMITNSKVKLIVGLSSYKIGTVDAYAGSGKNEWINNSDIISREVSAARNSKNYGGFALYRFDSVYSSSSGAKKELNSLKELM